MSNPKYFPVACEFYDHLVEIISNKKSVQIDYQDFEQNFYKIHSTPIDVKTENKEEFLYLENGEKIRLDLLHKVDWAISNNVLDRGNSCAG
jgi:transcriptional antiterminator Rof (Rho-off)